MGVWLSNSDVGSSTVLYIDGCFLLIFNPIPLGPTDISMSMKLPSQPPRLGWVVWGEVRPVSQVPLNGISRLNWSKTCGPASRFHLPGLPHFNPITLPGPQKFRNFSSSFRPYFIPYIFCWFLFVRVFVFDWHLLWAGQSFFLGLSR